MIEKKRFKQVISETTAAAGFQRAGQTWYRDAPDAVTLLDLQKDDFGPGYWVNLAVWLKALGEPDGMPPREQHAHVRVRASRVAADAAEQISVAFNPMHHSDGLVHESLLRDLLRDRVLPFLQQASTLQGLKELYRRGQLDDAAIVKEARAMIESRQP